jgi:methylglyoxal synthase
MGTAIKVLLYVAIVLAMYCEEYDVPVMMYVKRAKFLVDWKLAAYAQRQALKSYQSYRDEAEYVRG